MNLPIVLRNLIADLACRPDPRWRPEFDVLARYNAEVSRGVQHTPEWREGMADLQRQFNEAYHCE